MPHQIHQRKFGRKGDMRRKMLRNLTTSVLRYERVKTTEAKAKEIRGFVDRVINLGKDGGIEARRRATALIDEPIIVEKVFNELPKRYAGRTGGYLHLTRLPRRVGDASPLAMLELVAGADETKTAADAAEAEKKPRRRLALPRRSGEKKEDAAPAKAKKTVAKRKATAGAGAKGKD